MVLKNNNVRNTERDMKNEYEKLLKINIIVTSERIFVNPLYKRGTRTYLFFVQLV